MYPAHTFPSYFPKIHSNIIFPSMPRRKFGFMIPTFSFFYTAAQLVSAFGSPEVYCMLVSIYANK